MKVRLRFVHLVPALVALLLCAGMADAQAVPSTSRGQTVRGRVLDRNSGEPIAGASVRVVEEAGNAAVQGQSDVMGGFVISLPVAGTYRFTAVRIGFATFTSSPVVVAAGAVVDVELRMSPVAVALDSIAVSVRQVPPFRDQRAARFWDRADRNRGNFVTPDQINALPGARASDFLRQMPRVYMAGDGIRGTTVELGFSAARRCTPTLYIDGIRRRLQPGERLDDYVDRPKLWAIEVYPRSADAPPELPPDDNIQCGVVAIWTRNA
jgi:hypothetical protein